MKLDGRVISVSQLRDHLLTLPFGGFQPKFPVLHNTDTPDIALFNSWMATHKLTPEQWGRNLGAYYAGMGWNSMPHGFVLPDGRILLGAPFNVQGTHTPSWNRISIGLEMVGNFDREQFAGTPTETSAVAVFGELCLRLGWKPDDYVKGVRGVHLHREDSATTHKNCPGKNVVKAKFVQMVSAYIGDSRMMSDDRESHLDIPVAAAVVDASSLSDYEAISPWWVQLTLRDLGYKLGVDGKIGPDTKSVVKQFQQKHPPLIVDGIAGSATRLALKAAKEGAK